MSFLLNEYDVDDALARTDPDETPVLAKAVRILDRLVRWTNRNSDGWPYWSKPSDASRKLQELIASHHPIEIMRSRTPMDPDITEADLKKALTPIKGFLTKQGVEHSLILDDPPPPPCSHPAASVTPGGNTGYTCGECGQAVEPVVFRAVA